MSAQRPRFSPLSLDGVNSLLAAATALAVFALGMPETAESGGKLAARTDEFSSTASVVDVRARQ